MVSNGLPFAIQYIDLSVINCGSFLTCELNLNPFSLSCVREWVPVLHGRRRAYSIIEFYTSGHKTRWRSSLGCTHTKYFTKSIFLKKQISYLVCKISLNCIVAEMCHTKMPDLTWFNSFSGRSDYLYKSHHICSLFLWTQLRNYKLLLIINLRLLVIRQCPNHRTSVILQGKRLFTSRKLLRQIQIFTVDILVYSNQSPIIQWSEKLQKTQELYFRLYRPQLAS